MDTDTLDVSPPCNWRSVSRLSSVPRCSVPVAPTGLPVTFLARPVAAARSFVGSLRREHRYTRRVTSVSLTRSGRRPPDSDAVPKKCITNPPGYHRDPVVRRPPTTNAILPRLALRTLRTQIPGRGVSQPHGRSGTRRRLAPSETTVDFAKPSDRQPPDPTFRKEYPTCPRTTETSW